MFKMSHSASLQRAVPATPHGDKTLSQLIDVLNFGLILTLRHDGPDGIVNRVEVQ